MWTSLIVLAVSGTPQTPFALRTEALPVGPEMFRLPASASFSLKKPFLREACPYQPGISGPLITLPPAFLGVLPVLPYFSDSFWCFFLSPKKLQAAWGQDFALFPSVFFAPHSAWRYTRHHHVTPLGRLWQTNSSRSLFISTVAETYFSIAFLKSWFFWP